AMGIGQKQMNDIFKKADQEAYRYKYGEDIDTSSSEVPEPIMAALKKIGPMNEADYERIAKIIEVSSTLPQK
ncbi:hypothetical protein MK079_04735, partial [Candidatus Gracilibacteria bacterium]|nr:hypothetical protein [Candidatus Gracilibacteria bacterium]